jgi:hypothetical protein
LSAAVSIAGFFYLTGSEVHSIHRPLPEAKLERMEDASKLKDLVRNRDNTVAEAVNAIVAIGRMQILNVVANVLGIAAGVMAWRGLQPERDRVAEHDLPNEQGPKPE